MYVAVLMFEGLLSHLYYCTIYTCRVLCAKRMESVIFLDHYSQTKCINMIPNHCRFINPRRACAAWVTVLGVCVCVCRLSVFNSRPTGYEPAYKRYQRLMLTKGSKNYLCVRARARKWHSWGRHFMAQPIN